MRHIEVIAHKGAFAEPPPLPENSRAAFERAAAIGVDWAEFDVHTTSDGHLVVIHDETLDRVTNRSGVVAEMTLSEIQAASLDDGTTLPTADDVLRILHSRTGAYFEIKATSPKAVIDVLNRTNMIDSTVIYGRHDELCALRKLDPHLRLMMNRPPADVATLHHVMDVIRPEVFGSSSADISRVQADQVHAVGAKLWVNVLHTDNPTGWAHAIELGADALETDHPELCLTWLREQNLRR